MYYGCGYDELEMAMTARANVYPTWTYDRGQIDASPLVEQDLEVQPRRHLPRGIAHSQYVDAHRLPNGFADPGRALNHPSRIVAPVLISSNQPHTFDRPDPIIAWAPNPIVQRSYGQQTISVDDIRHTVPKQMPSYSYEALSQQEIADAAMLRVRKSMYGR